MGIPDGLNTFADAINMDTRQQTAIKKYGLDQKPQEMTRSQASHETLMIAKQATVIESPSKVEHIQMKIFEERVEDALNTEHLWSSDLKPILQYNNGNSETNFEHMTTIKLNPEESQISSLINQDAVYEHREIGTSVIDLGPLGEVSEPILMTHEQALFKEHEMHMNAYRQNQEE